MINKLVNLREEWEILSPKIDKLGSFVNGEEFNDLPPKDKAICEWTYKVMRDYHKALREIITISNDEGVSVLSIKEGRL
jgi:hypothetical protein